MRQPFAEKARMAKVARVGQSGTVLVLTLWVLTLLSALAFSFALSVRYGGTITRNFKESASARALAISAIENTVAYILSDQDMLIDYIGEDGLLHTDEKRAPATDRYVSEAGTVAISLTAEDAKPNINLMHEGNLLRLFEMAGASKEKAAEMITAFLDWTDPDKLVRLTGAEDEHYIPLGYTARNRELETPQELALIRGFDDPKVLGSEGEGNGLLNMVTTFSETINFNAASLEALEALGLDPVEASSIIDMRQSMNGIRHIPSKLARKGTPFSRVFRIEARASLGQSPEVYVITSIVRRQPGPKGQELKTVYWKERIETGGA